MLNLIRNLKLKTQLIMLSCIFSLLIIFLGSYLFTNMNRILNNNIEASTEQVFNHIEMEILTFFHDVEISANTISFMQPIQDSINSSSFPSYDLYSNMRQALNSVLLTNHNITSVILDLSNIELAFGDIGVVLDSIRNIEVDSYKMHFTDLLPYTYTNDPKNLNYFAAVYRVNNIRNLSSKEYAGNVVFVLNKNFFDVISSRYGITKNSKLYIVNNDNQVIGRGSNEADIITENMILNQISEPKTKSYINIDNKKFIYLAKEVGETGWKIISLTPYNEYFQELNKVTTVSLVIFISVMIILLSFSILITNSINKPLQNLLGAMKNIAGGNLKVRSNITLNNELGVLATHFDKMMDEIHTLTHTIFENQQQMYELELANKDARFLALQSQINPHFLYNALACIQGIALHYDINEIADVTQALASIFRYSIKENNYVTISAEVENIKNYILIHQIKSADNIEFILDIDPDVYCLAVPKLLLQPVVENAIIHGLSKKIGSGTLKVKGFVINDSIHFEIIDDGVGMTGEQLEEMNNIISNTSLPSQLKNSNRSIGIINIIQRLRLCYTDKYTFKIESSPQEGTKVTIEIPREEGEKA